MEENQTVPSLPASSGQADGGSAQADQKSSKAPVVLIIVAIVIVLLIIAGIVALALSNTETTGRVRDIFIILMALESLVTGVALIILIVQLATLINLLRNEIRPILDSTNETAKTLKGTVTFISENLTQPIITLNSYVAGIVEFFNLMRPKRPRR